MNQRPIELTIAIGVLVCEYLAILPGYISAFIAASSSGQATPAMGGAFFGFVLLRPFALYLLWRGTSWLRTLIIWTLPIFVGVSFLSDLGGSRTGGHTQGQGLLGAFDALRAGNIVTTVALLIGFCAFLTLYLPRVGAWFKYIKGARKTADVAI